MRITMLGTGTSQGIPMIGCPCSVCQSDDPKDKRLRPAMHIEKDGISLVVDIGPDFRQQMLRAKIDDIDAILVTHEHNDHIAGLDDVRPYNFLRNKNMPVYGLERVGQALKERFPYIFNLVNKYPGAPCVDFNEVLNAQPFVVKGIQILPIEVMHGLLPILGYRIDNFAYLTDVHHIEEASLSHLQGLDTLILSSLHHRQHHSHMTLEEALSLINILKPKKTYLMHMSHLMGLHAEISKDLPENVFFGYDGLVLEVVSNDERISSSFR